MRRLVWALMVLVGCGGRTGVHASPRPIDAGTPAEPVDAPADVSVHDAPLDVGCRPRLSELPPWAVAPASMELAMSFTWSEDVSGPLGAEAEVTLALVPSETGAFGVAHGPMLRFASAAAFAPERARIGCAAPGCELVLVTPGTACEDAAWLVLRDVELLARDLDCDGRADVLDGAGEARILVATSDAMSSRWIEGTVALAARPDTTAPSLSFESRDLPGAALRALRVVASEPLTTSTALDVLGMRSPPQRIVPDPRGWLTTADLEWAAPFGASETVYVAADATIADFSRHEASAETRALSWAGVPSSYPEDGFESGEGIALQSGARWVDGIGRIAPIAGWRSLWLPPGHLPEAPEPRWAFVRWVPTRAVAQLGLDVQFVGDVASVDPRARFEITVFDGMGVRGSTALAPRGPFEATGEPGLPFASAPSRESVALTGVRPGVPLVVVIRAESVQCGQPSPGAHGLLVDGLRFE
jgi:hypothetical protein